MTKKILYVVLLVLLCVCTVTSCGKDSTPVHTHSFGEWSTTKTGTCKEAGMEARYCDCGETQTREIDIIDHVYSVWNITKEATCTTNGTKERFCNCGDRQVADIAAFGHSFGAWTETKAATCSENGEEERTCICGEKEINVIPISHQYIGSDCSICGMVKPSAGLKFEYVTGGYKVSGIGTCNESELVIPSTYNNKPVVEIGDRSFCYCKNLTSVYIPDSVVIIGSKAFYDCSNLKNVTIGNRVTTIGDSAFGSCDMLTSITFGDNITTIGDDAFLGNNNLEEIHIKSIEAWCKIKFVNEYANPLYDTADLYIDGNVLIDLVIPSTITEINNYAFNNCRKLKSVIISDGVTKIGKYAFNSCTSLEKVIISDTVKKIGTCSFLKCDTLSIIYLGKGLTDIECYAFACNKIKTVYYSGTKAEWENIFIDANAFLNSYTVYFERNQSE